MNAADTHTHTQGKKSEHEARLYTVFGGVRHGMTLIHNFSILLNATERNAYSMKSKFVARKKEKEQNVYVNHIFLCLHE